MTLWRERGGKEREVTTCQTNRNHLTYILRPRRPAPRHSALNPTILTRVVSHTRPKKHLRSLLRSWEGRIWRNANFRVSRISTWRQWGFPALPAYHTQMALYKFRHLVPVQYSRHLGILLQLPHILRRLFCMWRPSRSIKLWRVRESHPGIKPRSYRSLKDRRSKSQPRSALNETKRHWRKWKL